jgi:hypothetical protein
LAIRKNNQKIRQLGDKQIQLLTQANPLQSLIHARFLYQGVKANPHQHGPQHDFHELGEQQAENDQQDAKCDFWYCGGHRAAETGEGPKQFSSISAILSRALWIELLDQYKPEFPHNHQGCVPGERRQLGSRRAALNCPANARQQIGGSVVVKLSQHCDGLSRVEFWIDFLAILHL